MGPFYETQKKNSYATYNGAVASLHLLSESVRCAPGSVEKLLLLWNTDVLPMKGKKIKLPAGVITCLYPEVCLERGSSGVVTLQTW